MRQVKKMSCEGVSGYATGRQTVGNMSAESSGGLGSYKNNQAILGVNSRPATYWMDNSEPRYASGNLSVKESYLESMLPGPKKEYEKMQTPTIHVSGRAGAKYLKAEEYPPIATTNNSSVGNRERAGSFTTGRQGSFTVGGMEEYSAGGQESFTVGGIGGYNAGGQGSFTVGGRETGYVDGGSFAENEDYSMKFKEKKEIGEKACGLLSKIEQAMTEMEAMQ